MSTSYGTQVLVRSDAGSLWRDAVALVAQEGEVVAPVTSGSSPSYGVATREVRGVKLVLTEPRARYIASQVRPLNSTFCIGNFLYFLSESSLVEPLRYYNPNAERFSDDGRLLHGAYGPRLLIQLSYIKSHLARDPTSRRAVTLVMDAGLDLVEESHSRDIPCPVSIQWLVRDGALEVHAVLRSQNVAMVFPYDVFLLTMIQEWLAADLGVRCGAFVQYVASLHYYAHEQDLAERIVQGSVGTIIMPPMTRLGDRLIDILRAEDAWRRWGSSDVASARPVSPVKWSDHPYWNGVINMLISIATRKRSGEDVVRDDGMFRTAWDRTSP